MKKVLLTSVVGPIGPDHGDAPSVGYELLFGQVTRAQGLFSPRALHLHFSLDYVAENLDAPAVVLQYPRREDLIRELKKGYDVVGVSFLLAVFHRMKETVALIREHAPRAEIVLGGYGTVLSDEVLRPYGDHICRGEGVAFMRRLLGEPPLPMPYSHPLVVSRLKIFSVPVSKTGMIFAGLGCPNGCDFCCTSHFFGRKHIKLLPSGRDIWGVIERYREADPAMSFVILDEDFLLNKRRALEFRDCVRASGEPPALFVFSSVRAISQFTVEEILEMGIDGFWIGYEGTRSGYAKQQGRAVEELFPELRGHGVTILASMIVGLPYQTPEIIRSEFDGLMALKPSLTQFLIYGPTPGTPFYQRIMTEGLLHRDLAEDPERYYKRCDGFTAMVTHPAMAPAAIEASQRWCFAEDFARLGPSIFRVIEVWLNGYRRLKGSTNPILRAKAAGFARELRKSYPVFLAGRLLGPNAPVRAWIGDLERAVNRELGAPTLAERTLSCAAVGAALWTGLTLKMDWLQHPRAVRHVYRLPEEAPAPARAWRTLSERWEGVSVEARPERTVWVYLRQLQGGGDARRLAAAIGKVLEVRRERVVLDLKKVPHLDGETAKQLARHLAGYKDRVRLSIPPAFLQPHAAAWLAMFTLYR